MCRGGGVMMGGRDILEEVDGDEVVVVGSGFDGIFIRFFFVFCWCF